MGATTGTTTGATDNLRQAADATLARAKEAGGPAFDAPMRRLQQAAQRVGLAWCGSWLPGMANLYGQALQPSAGGLPKLQEGEGSGRVGWVTWAPDDIRNSIHLAAGQPDMQLLQAQSARTAGWFEDARNASLPALVVAMAQFPDDTVLPALLREARQLQLTDQQTLLAGWRPTCKAAPRSVVGKTVGKTAGNTDAARNTAGDPTGSTSADWEVPAHLTELAAIEAMRSPLTALQTLASLLRRAAEHYKSLHQQALLAAREAAQLANAQRAPAFAAIGGLTGQHAPQMQMQREPQAQANVQPANVQSANVQPPQAQTAMHKTPSVLPLPFVGDHTAQPRRSAGGGAGVHAR